MEVKQKNTIDCAKKEATTKKEAMKNSKINIINKNKIYAICIMKEFSKLCTPAKIYFAIAVVATVMGLLNGFSLMMAFWKLVFAFIWTYVLGWLCQKGFHTLSWFLVLLPYIVILLAMFNIYHITFEQRQLMRTMQLQGAYGQEAMSAMPANVIAPKKK